jgi:hypothetical protein
MNPPPSPLGAWGGGVVQCLLGKGTVRYWGREESRNEDLKQKEDRYRYSTYFTSTDNFIKGDGAK